MRDVAYDLVENAVKTRYEDLPRDVVDVTKKFILDTIGTAIAGSTAPGCKGVADLAHEFAGRKDSTVWVYGGKVPAHEAALANGTMSQALDLDDVHDIGAFHANCSVLPASLSMAELKGNVSGKDLITGVAVGVDALVRIGVSVIGPLSWVITSLAGHFGATLGAGKVLGLDQAKLHHALGIALEQCGGSSQAVIDRALVKRMLAGFCARTGVTSCLYAEKGISGPKDIFEGKWGLYNLYYGGKFDRSKLTDGLGKEFTGKTLSIKFHIGGRYTHPCNDIAQEIAIKSNLKAEDVAEITMHVPENSFIMVGRPFTIGENPQVDAQFSIPYGVALAIVHHSDFVGEFQEDRIRNDKVALDLAARVKVIGDQGSIEKVGRRMTPVIMQVKTKDGRLIEQRTDSVSGEPGRAPLEKVEEKFRKCCAYSARPVPPNRVEELINICRKLEDLPNVSGLVKLLA